VAKRARDILISTAAVIAFVLAWQVISLGADKTLLPGPVDVFAAFVELGRTGVLWTHISASMTRVFLGWAIGCLVAIPLGLLAGTSRVARAAIDPFIHFFRFVPALALVSLFILWFGIGEQSKVNLVAYAVAFIVTVNTAAGAASVPEDKLNAAYCVGASRSAALRSVVLPATIPYIFTGMRLALANAFLVIVAAEALATQTGIGFLIWNARTFFRTDWVFVGIFCFGILGFAADRLWKQLGATVLQRYTRASGGY
jgi:ABC-type nitrate/sulfonate/bicarbonate transport system permease component